MVRRSVYPAVLLCICALGCDRDGSDTAAMGSEGSGSDAGVGRACDECLDTLCAAPQAACDSACLAVQACIAMLCAHLKAIGSAEEGDCQQSCQAASPGGKTPHLAVVECAVSGVCFPPCLPYPQDVETCRAWMDMGDCAAALAACETSAECNAYRGCVSTCATLAQCLACDGTSEGMTGRALLEAYERCIAGECVTESWLPPFPP